LQVLPEPKAFVAVRQSPQYEKFFGNTAGFWFAGRLPFRTHPTPDDGDHHAHEVGVLVLASVQVRVAFRTPAIGVQEKAATGAEPAAAGRGSK
jgi:hypothetical protein